ncbi:MAG: efflux RND transporter periplasmic adaptor subunit [Chitinophagaceae bacterium]
MQRFFISFGLIFLLFASCKSKSEKIKPLEEKITESVYASGILKSKNQYLVFSSLNGLVAQVFVAEGQLVKKGDPIIRLTNTTAQLNTEYARISADYSSPAANSEKLYELKISIDLAKSKMDNEASLLERQRSLWAQQIGTRNELDQRELAYTSAVNAFETAKLRYTELQKQISFQSKQSQKNLQISKTIAGDYTIKSETAGKVYSILKEKGEMVNTQSPVALVGDANAFTLELQVDEYDIARVRVGQKILLSMDSYKGQVFEAVVEKINPLMNDRSKSFTLDAGFVTQPPVLYPNLTCEANIVIAEKEKALTIPRACLLEGDYVLLATKEKRKVTTGLKDYQKVEILSGLKVTDIILKQAQ